MINQLRYQNAMLTRSLEEQQRGNASLDTNADHPPPDRLLTRVLKRPQEINAIPMLSSLTDATAYGKWRRAWSHQIKLIEPETETDSRRVAFWMCAHSTDDAATLLQNNDTTPRSPDHVFHLIREAAKQRVPVTERTLNLARMAFRAGDTPRTFANRVLDTMHLFDMGDDLVLPYVQEASRGIGELRLIARSAKSVQEWLDLLADAGDADTLVVLPKPSANDSNQVAAISPSSNNTRKPAKSKFLGACWACQKPGHRVRECRNRAAKERFDQHRTATAASSAAAVAALTAVPNGANTPN